MNWTLLDRNVQSWAIAGVAAAAVLVIVPLLRAIVRKKARKLAPEDFSFAGFLLRLSSSWLSITTLALALAAGLVVLNSEFSRAAKTLVVVGVAIQFMAFIPICVEWGLRRLANSKRVGHSAHSVIETISGLRWAVLCVAYSFILLLALQNLGVDITALIAGLGIGGVAVALAVQNILGDLFASLTIALDKPFVVGDFIVAGDEMGTIEHVGLKTTRVRSLSGEQLVFSNSDLLSSRIRNYKRMSERRVLFNFGVPYSTASQVLIEIPSLVREAVETQADVRFDRCHLFRFGNSSLDFETVYYVKSADYNRHMDVQQSIYLSIIGALRQRRVDFALPAQTLRFARRPRSGERTTKLRLDTDSASRASERRTP